MLALLRTAALGAACTAAIWGSWAQAQAAEQGAVRIVFGGDVMLDAGPGHAIVHGADPFAEFAPILRTADISVCNLECVIAEGGKRADKKYTFRAPEQAIPLLKRNFSAVCVANNHSGDFGKEAFARQLTALDSADLPYFGGGRTRAEAHRPLILTRNGLRIALLAYSSIPPRSFRAGEHKPGVAWLVEKRVLRDIKTARESEQADVVIPFLHWGQGEEPEPTEAQRALARRLIDAGATAVVGGHPHVTQTVDWYQGRPIIYSLGNFVFNYYPVDPAVWTGWIVRLTLRKGGTIDMETFVLQIDKTGMPHLLPAPAENPDHGAPPQVHAALN